MPALTICSKGRNQRKSPILVHNLALSKVPASLRFAIFAEGLEKLPKTNTCVSGCVTDEVEQTQMRDVALRPVSDVDLRI
jgi:hypothetical protein